MDLFIWLLFLLLFTDFITIIITMGKRNFGRGKNNGNKGRGGGSGGNSGGKKTNQQPQQQQKKPTKLLFIAHQPGKRPPHTYDLHRTLLLNGVRQHCLVVQT